MPIIWIYSSNLYRSEDNVLVLALLTTGLTELVLSLGTALPCFLFSLRHTEHTETYQSLVVIYLLCFREEKQGFRTISKTKRNCYKGASQQGYSNSDPGIV